MADERHCIENEGQIILEGDSKSIGIIFNNLSGKNFRNKEEYSEYLSMVRFDWDETLKNDSVIRVCKGTTVLKESKIGSEFIR